MRRRTRLWLLLPILLVSPAIASDQLQIDARTTSGVSIARSVQGTNLVSLTDRLVKAEDQFAAFAGQSYVASLQYSGVKNAAIFTSNADGTSVNVRIPSTGFNRTFTGANRDDVNKQIRDFVKKDGAAELADFQEKVNRLSLTAVSDGNPRSTTAWLSNQAFRSFGFDGRPPFGAEGDSVVPGLRLDFDGGSFDTDDGSGYYFEAALSTGFKLGSRAAISLTVPFQYRNVDGSDIFDVGFQLGLPFQILRKNWGGKLSGEGASEVTWQVSPWGVIAASGSEDLVAGGIMYGGGITSLLSYQIGLGGPEGQPNNLTFSLVNQIGFYHGSQISAGGYEFKNDVDQQVLKNGLAVAYSIGRSLWLDASIIHTQFLRDSAIDHYWTPGAGAGFFLSKNTTLRVAYSADLGTGFTGHNGNVSLSFGW